MPATTLSESRIIVVVGLPGCGKSTWLVQQNIHAISSDGLRLQLGDDENDQTIHGRVFSAVRYLLRERLEIGRPATYIDATNLTRRERRPYLQIAREYGCLIEALWFDAPLDVCKLRNAARHRVVPDWAIDLMAARFVPPSLSEGFSQVRRIG